LVILGLGCVVYGASESSLSRFGRVVFIILPVFLFEVGRSYNICGTLELDCIGNQFFYDVLDIGSYFFYLFIAASILIGGSVIIHHVRKG